MALILLHCTYSERFLVFGVMGGLPMQYIKLLGQVFLLWMIFWAGTEIVNFTHLPLPGNVMGMLLLFVLLLTGIVKPIHIESATNLLLKHMSFLFVPIAVGLMDWGNLFVEHGVVLMGAIAAAAMVSIAVTGFTVLWLPKGRDTNG